MFTCFSLCFCSAQDENFVNVLSWAESNANMAVSDIENLTVLVKYVEWFELNGWREIEGRFDSVAYAVNPTGYSSTLELLKRRFQDGLSLPGVTMNLALFSLLCDMDKFNKFSEDIGLKTGVSLHGVLGVSKKEVSRVSDFRESILNRIDE